MTILRKSGFTLVIVFGAASMLAGCASGGSAQKRADEATARQFDTFGRANRQNIVAQIADPDPAWKNSPAPNSDGKRAQDRQSIYTTSSKELNGANGGIAAN